MHLDFVNELLGQYGLYAVFILVMLEGDITLLLAGVLAHSGFFGEYSFARVLIWGTLGGCLSDNLAYFTGPWFLRRRKRSSFLQGREAKAGETDQQVWRTLDLPFQVHLRTALGSVRVLWRRANALPAVPVPVVRELLPVGFRFGWRGLLLQRRGDGPDWRFPTVRKSAAGDRGGWHSRVLPHRAILDLEES